MICSHVICLIGSSYVCCLLSISVYEALENYIPQSEDEVGFKAGDKVEVIAKSMDGWWKIK